MESAAFDENDPVAPIVEQVQACLARYFGINARIQRAGRRLDANYDGGRRRIFVVVSDDRTDVTFCPDGPRRSIDHGDGVVLELDAMLRQEIAGQLPARGGDPASRLFRAIEEAEDEYRAEPNRRGSGTLPRPLGGGGRDLAAPSATRGIDAMDRWTGGWAEVVKHHLGPSARVSTQGLTVLVEAADGGREAWFAAISVHLDGLDCSVFPDGVRGLPEADVEYFGLEYADPGMWDELSRRLNSFHGRAS